MEEKEEETTLLDASPDLAERIFQQFTRVDREALKGGEVVPRRTYTFILDGASCEPGVFQTPDGKYFDCKITLRSLRSDEELEALSTVQSAGQVPGVLTKKALWQINGKTLTFDQKTFFWEAFGMTGRTLCTLAFQTYIGSAGEGALGKLLPKKPNASKASE